MHPSDNTHQLGRELFRDERYDESVHELESWLRIHPDDAIAHHDLAAPLFALGELARAEAAAQRAVALEPSFVQAWSTLATIQSQRGQTGTPLRSMLQATRLEPDNMRLRQRLGIMLIDQGHADAAIGVFRTIVRNEPDNLDASAGLATALERIGKLDAAFSIMETAIDAGAIHARLGATWATVCRRRGEPERGIPILTNMLEGPMNASARILLLTELGAAQDQLGHCDAAFSAYTRANELRRGRFDPAALSQQTDAIINAFSAETLAELPRSTHRSEQPLFIVGMPRSGTSLVEQILASHPDVFGGGELEDLRVTTILGARETDDDYPGCIQGLTPRDVTEIGQWYLDRRQRTATAARVTDKMPQNFQHLGWASLILPGARVIHCKRDPLDTALSCYFQGFRDSLAWSNRLDWLGCFIQQYQRLMDHWNEVCPLPIHEVDYQALVSDPEPNIRSLIDFCGLDWDDTVLSHHTSGRTVDTASYAQATRPIYRSSVGRSLRYSNHLSPLQRILAGA